MVTHRPFQAASETKKESGNPTVLPVPERRSWYFRAGSGRRQGRAATDRCGRGRSRHPQAPSLPCQLEVQGWADTCQLPCAAPANTQSLAPLGTRSPTSQQDLPLAVSVALCEAGGCALPVNVEAVSAATQHPGNGRSAGGGRGLSKCTSRIVRAPLQVTNEPGGPAHP